MSAVTRAETKSGVFAPKPAAEKLPYFTISVTYFGGGGSERRRRRRLFPGPLGSHGGRQDARKGN